MPTIQSLTWNAYAPVALAKWYEVHNLTPRTVESHQAILDKYILPVIGEEPIYLLDDENTNLKMLIQRLMAVKPYKTRRNRVGLLRRLLRTAKNDGFLTKIPTCVQRISIANEKPAPPKQDDLFSRFFDDNFKQTAHPDGVKCANCEDATRPREDYKNCLACTILICEECYEASDGLCLSCYNKKQATSQPIQDYAIAFNGKETVKLPYPSPKHTK